MATQPTSLFLPEDPAVLSALGLNNLAELYSAQGRYAEAEPLFQRSLPTIEKALGLEHPYVAASIRDYAMLLRATGREAEAADLKARVETMHVRRRRTLPPANQNESHAAASLGDIRMSAGPA